MGNSVLFVFYLLGNETHIFSYLNKKRNDENYIVQKAKTEARKFTLM